MEGLREEEGAGGICVLLCLTGCNRGCCRAEVTFDDRSARSVETIRINLELFLFCFTSPPSSSVSFALLCSLGVRHARGAVSSFLPLPPPLLLHLQEKCKRFMVSVTFSFLFSSFSFFPRSSWGRSRRLLLQFLLFLVEAFLSMPLVGAINILTEESLLI